VRADPGKIQAMVDWPFPKTLKSLAGFLGPHGLLPQVHPEAMVLLQPPSLPMLKKNFFSWGDLAIEAFQILRLQSLKLLSCSS
jgi:hypothetical protein